MRTINNLSDAEQITLTFTPAVCSLVSFLGSGTILYSISRDFSRKLRSLKYRILAAICISDLINSSWYGLWALPIPRGSPGVWGAIGNTASCSAQGFFLHLGNVGAAYNGALALYFLLSLRYRMQDEVIAKKYEIYMHLWGLIWPLSTGLIALSIDLFNFGGVGCWIAPYPYQCHLDDNVECIRGKQAYVYAWLFTGVPVAVTNIIIVVCMVLTYQAVRTTYQRAQLPIDRAVNSGHLPEGDAQASKRRHARKIEQAGLQSFLYSAAYFVTHLWAFVIVGIEHAGGKLYFYVLFLQVGGFIVLFIACVFCREFLPRTHPSLPSFSAVFLAIARFL